MLIAPTVSVIANQKEIIKSQEKYLFEPTLKNNLFDRNIILKKAKRANHD